MKLLKRSDLLSKVFNHGLLLPVNPSGEANQEKSNQLHF